MSQKFEGIFPYLVSPVDDQGNVKEEELARLVDHLIACGVHGLTPLGSTGEFYYLSWEQKMQIVRTVVQATDHRVPVVAGVASASTREAVAQAKAFARMGVDGILGILNVYFPLGQEQVYQYYRDLALATELPVVIYNNPRFSGFEISVDTLLRLSKLPTVQYYKDASFNTGRLLSIISQVGEELRIFSASAHIPTFVMEMGGVGWMSGPACLIPRESVRLYRLCREKRWEEAMVLQKKLWEINTLFQKYNLAACVKEGLGLQGFDMGGPIAPTPRLDAAGVAAVKAALEKVAEQTGEGSGTGHSGTG